MPTEDEPSPQSEKAFTAEDVELADHNAAAARERAARADYRQRIASRNPPLGTSGSRKSKIKPFTKASRTRKSTAILR